MIYVVELPDDRAPHAWFAFDDSDFVRKVTAELSPEEEGIFDVAAPRDAAMVTLRARGKHIVYWNDRDAVAAFEGADARLTGQANWKARHALYEQLIALEVLADDN